MFLQSQKIDNMVLVKKLGTTLKIVSFKYPIRQSGFEKEEIYESKRTLRNKNEKKMRESISRSKSKIFEYAMCNDFDYFVTFTLNKEKYDRTDLKKFIKDLGQFIRNYRRKYKRDIQYLFIPELHADKTCWHMHGLIRGIEPDQLHELTSDMYLPDKIRNQLIKGNKIFDWKNYSDKFGYCTLSPIRNQSHCAMYITKYISKYLSESIEKDDRCYYSSRGLQKAELIKKGTLDKCLDEKYWSYSNDWVNIKNIDITNMETDHIQNYLNSIISDL